MAHSNVTTGVDFLEDSVLLKSFNMAYAILLIIFMPGIITGNMLLIVTIFVFKNLRHYANFMLLSLAAADLFVGVFTCPLNAAAFLESKAILYDGAGCLLWTASKVVGCIASVSNIFVIIIDRYTAMCHPAFHFQYFRFHNVVIVLVVVWVYTIVVGSLPLMGWNTYDKSKRCSMHTVLTTVYLLSTMFATLGVCLFGSFFLYVRIFFHVRSNHNQVSGVSCKKSMDSKVQLKRDIRATKVTAFIFVTLVLFWAPYFVVRLIRVLGIWSETREVIKNGFQVLAISNSLVNPIVFAFTKKKFRYAYALLVTTPLMRYSTLRHMDLRDVVSGSTTRRSL